MYMMRGGRFTLNYEVGKEKHLQTFSWIGNMVAPSESTSCRKDNEFSGLDYSIPI